MLYEYIVCTYIFFYSVITLWRFAAVGENHFEILTYKLLECDDFIFLLLDKYDMKRKLYSIFTHIYAREV